MAKFIANRSKVSYEFYGVTLPKQGAVNVTDEQFAKITAHGWYKNLKSNGVFTEHDEFPADMKSQAQQLNEAVANSAAANAKVAELQAQVAQLTKQLQEVMQTANDAVDARDKTIAELQAQVAQLTGAQAQ